MKIGEALSLRAKQAQKLNELKGRIVANCQVEEGKPPTEQPDALVEEYLAVSGDHMQLVSRIQRTNAETIIDGVTVLELLQERDALIRERNIYTAAAEAAQPKRGGFYAGTEKSYQAAVDVRNYREQADAVNVRISRLDAQIQQTNWVTEVIE